ncbi:Protein CBG28119 [Caenorhabditis briggsae]|uniref:Protein CBG28119 n=1 Tax=Caenorhabditis briggsae TaxID=6238 RepID=B6IGV8_CAEBR|nr:Protein CBG28119 [Caenorhabditis briggsae]CAR99138.1 Protein CBG28119 [Caenorhabditis briggsae]
MKPNSTIIYKRPSSFAKQLEDQLDDECEDDHVDHPIPDVLHIHRKPGTNKKAPSSSSSGGKVMNKARPSRLDPPLDNAIVMARNNTLMEGVGGGRDGYAAGGGGTRESLWRSRAGPPGLAGLDGNARPGWFPTNDGRSGADHAVPPGNK